MKIPVELGTRRYEVEIADGLLTQAGEKIAALKPAGSVGIITDENVAKNHLQTLTHSLEKAGLPYKTCIVPAGERSKSWEMLQKTTEQLLEARIERNGIIIALGGGVVGDLAGFCASILRRGVRFVQIPTSLLAQVDSSVGGKTGINSPFGKNLIGAFHQPTHVLIDPQALSTLPPRHLRAGYAEILKGALIGDANFYQMLDNSLDKIFNPTPERLEAITKAVHFKAGIVERDEREDGERALLNLGHTFGHALETLTNYDEQRLLHGEGVSIGLYLAARMSEELGYAENISTPIRQHLKAANLPWSISQIPGEPISAETIVSAMMQDKKANQGLLQFILLQDIGKAFIQKDIPPQTVLTFLGKETNPTGHKSHDS